MLQEVVKPPQQRKVSLFLSTKMDRSRFISEVHPDAVSETPPSKPTVDEAKAAQERSPALRNAVRVLRALASLSEKLESVLEGTPLATPVKAINIAVDVVEVRHTGSSSYVSHSSRDSTGREWYQRSCRYRNTQFPQAFGDDLE
jgi:hypothetical protein